MNLQNNPNLTAWLTQPEQPLPKSLKMAFVKDALRYILSDTDITETVYQTMYTEHLYIEDMNTVEKTLYIQTLLSRIDGKAVLPFLDVESKEYNKKYNNFYDIIENGISTSEDIHNFLKLKLPPQTLQEQMSLAFWRALSMEGKNVDEALEVITKIYLKELYV
jgi:hypothetical protein